MMAYPANVSQIWQLNREWRQSAHFQKVSYEARAKSCQDCKEGHKKGRYLAHIWRWFDGLFTIIHKPLACFELSRRYHLESA